MVEKKFRIVKCAQCGNKLDRNTEPFESKSNKHYHASCYTVFRQKADSRKDLIDYICKLYELDAPTGFILKQIKKFEEPPYNMRHAGMKATLYYFHELKGNEVFDNAGIGIIEYVYQDARNYFETLAHVRDHNSKTEIDREEKVVRVREVKKNKRFSPIDMESI